jgi:hypothetical protein
MYAKRKHYGNIKVKVEKIRKNREGREEKNGLKKFVLAADLCSVDGLKRQKPKTVFESFWV